MLSKYPCISQDLPRPELFHKILRALEHLENPIGQVNTGEQQAD